MFYVTKLQKLSDMTKPRLVKVRALFYVLQHIIKRGCAYFDTAPLLDFAVWLSDPGEVIKYECN